MSSALRSLLLTGLAVLVTAGPSFAAPAPDELLRDALAARAAGRTAEAVRLLTELKALTPGDKRIETLLSSLQGAAISASPSKSIPQGAAVSKPPSPAPGTAGLSTRPAPATQGAAISAGDKAGKDSARPDYSESPTESPKAKPSSDLLSEAKSRPNGTSSSAIPNQESKIPDKATLLQAALSAQAEGKTEQALAYLRELQNLSPNDPRISSVVSALTPQGAAISESPTGSPKEKPDSDLLSEAKSRPSGALINQESQIKNQESLYYGLPESLVLGVVTWVDPVNKQAVVRLYGTWKPDRLYLLSRDASFEASAILETSPFHNSRAIGVRAIEGMPRLGQEVIAPGPSVLKRIQEILGPRFRGTPPAPVVKTADPAAPLETAAPAGTGSVDPGLKPF